MTSVRAKDGVQKTWALLRQAHPDAHCELVHRSPFELLVATVLSAQSTDVAVNKVTPALFSRWPTPEALGQAAPADVEAVLGQLGMFRQKTKHVIGLSKLLVQRHDGKVPTRLDELVALPGVGRKTANVVLGVAFGAAEGVVVDTHVQRIAQRLGWTAHTEPAGIEQDLMGLFPKPDWDTLSHTLIFHGRRVCSAQRPGCAVCAVHKLCPSAFDAEDVGRKPKKTRLRTAAAVGQSKVMAKPPPRAQTTAKPPPRAQTTAKRPSRAKATAKPPPRTRAAPKRPPGAEAGVRGTPRPRAAAKHAAGIRSPK